MTVMTLVHEQLSIIKILISLWTPTIYFWWRLWFYSQLEWIMWMGWRWLWRRLLWLPDRRLLVKQVGNPTSTKDHCSGNMIFWKRCQKNKYFSSAKYWHNLKIWLKKKSIQILFLFYFIFILKFWIWNFGHYFSKNHLSLSTDYTYIFFVNDRNDKFLALILTSFTARCHYFRSDKVQKMGIASLGQFSHVIILFKLL
jgi:hypothetical protein